METLPNKPLRKDEALAKVKRYEEFIDNKLKVDLDVVLSARESLHQSISD
jgi:hypothetical protein